MPLSTVDLTPRIGTQVMMEARALLSGQHVAELRALLDQRGVLLFRGIDFDDAQELAFAKTLGTLRVEYDGPIMKVTLDESHNARADYFRATVSWHMDGTHEDTPPWASILAPRVLSTTGGQTEFANAYAAYEDLPESEKKFLAGLKVLHTKQAAFLKYTPNPTKAQLDGLNHYQPKIHPLVWTHRSGRKSLVVSTSAAQVIGMDVKESEALFGRLTAWITQRQYVYQHQWRMGDLLIWDNTGTLHRVLPYDVESRRRLHRVTLEGDERMSVAA